MITFDEILPRTIDVLNEHRELVVQLGEIIVNRDLNGRVRLIVSEAAREHKDRLEFLAQKLAEQLKPHTYPADSLILYEEDLSIACMGVSHFTLETLPQVRVVDRLAVESHWDKISSIAEGVHRIVFYSIKGGVGRSTALAVTAWSLAQRGMRVLVLDLDLESPGLSSALLPEERRPAYGITDWLLEDLVDNGEAVIGDLIATSPLSHDGEIYVVPAHGREPGEYVSKLGRIWMPKPGRDGGQENWSQRLGRLIDELEERWQPDVILLDSRAGIDEIASSSVTDLGAALVLLFAIDGEQTWSGYRILFEYWSRSDKVKAIRERLQLVGAMVPDDETRKDYFDRLREAGADLFAEYLYDEIPPGETEAGYFSFDEHDESAPHFPWLIRWQRGFSALRSVHDRLSSIDQYEVESVFAPLINGVQNMIEGESSGE